MTAVSVFSGIRNVICFDKYLIVYSLNIRIRMMMSYKKNDTIHLLLI